MEKNINNTSSDFLDRLALVEAQLGDAFQDAPFLADALIMIQGDIAYYRSFHLLNIVLNFIRKGHKRQLLFTVTKKLLRDRNLKLHQELRFSSYDEFCVVIREVRKANISKKVNE